MGFFREIFQMGLSPFEKLLFRLYKVNESIDLAPIFIIGAPRSGSTLLYQVMAHYFYISYMSNFTRSFFKVPMTGFWIQKYFNCFYSSMKFKSVYGRTTGLFGPNESADFWYQWFPSGTNVYVGSEDISEEMYEDLRKQMTKIISVTKKPIILKNLYNSMRIPALRKAFPEALFIVCHRNPVDIAQSILLSREKLLGSRSVWWSVPPREYPEIINHPPVQQIVEQVYYIYKQIDNDLMKHKSNNITIEYEQLCNHPKGVMEDIKSFCEKRKVQLKNIDNLPETFDLSSGIKVSKSDYQEIQKHTDMLFNETS